MAAAVLAPGATPAEQAQDYIVVLKSSCKGSAATVAAQRAHAVNGRPAYVFEHALKGFVLRLPPSLAERLPLLDSRVAYVAGNGNSFGFATNACNQSPARVAAAMTISATDSTDRKAVWANYWNCVDFFAPGVSITSAWSSGDSATNTISGTSMATPHAAGVAALYLQGSPGAIPAAVRTALFGLTTKGIVTAANTTNNHLLFTEGCTGPTDTSETDPPPPPRR